MTGPDGNSDAATEAGHERMLTWAALLAHWADFAASFVALPATAEGQRMKAAAAPLIGLQALTQALGELNELPFDEYAVGQDKAELLLRGYAAELNGLWRGESLPEAVREFIDDARAALELTRTRGVEWAAREGVAMLSPEAHGAVAAAAGAFPACELWAVDAGQAVALGMPLVFVRGRRGAAAPAELLAALGRAAGGSPRAVADMRQVYQSVEAGAVTLTCAAMTDDLPAGRPLLRRL